MSFDLLSSRRSRVVWPDQSWTHPTCVACLHCFWKLTVFVQDQVQKCNESLFTKQKRCPATTGVAS
jgi:hypothetical protein